MNVDRGGTFYYRIYTRAKYIAHPIWGEGGSKTKAFRQMKKECRVYSKRYILHHGFIGDYAYETHTGLIASGNLRGTSPSNSCKKN